MLHALALGGEAGVKVEPVQGVMSVKSLLFVGSCSGIIGTKCRRATPTWMMRTLLKQRKWLVR